MCVAFLPRYKRPSLYALVVARVFARPFRGRQCVRCWAHLQPTSGNWQVGAFAQCIYQIDMLVFRRPQTVCPCTPPPSPNQARSRPERNLVLISTLLIDPLAPNFDTRYHSTQRSTSVDFNCLDLVISVPSWVVVIDFFNGSSATSKDGPSRKEGLKISHPQGKIKVNLSMSSNGVK